MKYNLKEINGFEIIDFLNQVDINKEEEFGDTNLSRPLIYKHQVIVDNKLNIYFDCYFNNWGTDQLVEDNYISISNTRNKVTVSLDEPLEGDGTDDMLSELVEKFITSYKFKTKDELKLEFNALVEDIKILANSIQYGKPESLDKLSDLVTKAKTLSK